MSYIGRKDGAYLHNMLGFTQIHNQETQINTCYASII